MIDVYAPVGLFKLRSERAIGERLTKAVLRAEGVSPRASLQLDNTAAFIHILPASRLQTAASSGAQAVPVQVLTPPSALSRDGQNELVREITEMIASVVGDSTLQQRTWVPLTEAVPGGWRISDTWCFDSTLIHSTERCRSRTVAGYE